MPRFIQLFLLISSFCDGAHILFLVVWQSKSHFGSMLPLMNRLSDSGHNVGVYFEIAQQEKLPSNLENYLAVHGSYELLASAMNPVFFDLMWNGESRPWSLYRAWIMSAAVHEEICDKHDHFWKIANISWDLIVVDSLFCIAGLDLAFRQPAPTVIFHTSLSEYPFAYYRGRSWSTVTGPTMFISHETDQWSTDNFWDRFDSFERNAEFLFTYYAVERLVQKYSTSERIFSWREYMLRSPIGFSDQPDTISWSLPLTPETIPVGTCPENYEGQLSDEIEAFVSDPESNGTILVAFGTVLSYDMVPKDRFEALVEGLSRLREYRVVWAYRNGPKIEMPDHILTLDWVPQALILRHKNTKLFVSHGGLKSFKETICNEIPAVYLPLFAEQVTNSFLARKLGFGGYLNKKHLTADKMENEIRRILSDKTVYDNVKRAKRIWTDRIIAPLDLGEFWANKVLKGVNGQYLRPKSVTLATWKSANFDVLSIAMLLLLCLEIYIVGCW